jgi:hypothetical protein
MAIRSCLVFVGSVHGLMAKPPRFSSVLGNLVAALVSLNCLIIVVKKELLKL